MRILVDAMGGDNAPAAIVKGCVDADTCEQGYDITLIGDDNKIYEILSSVVYDE